ncbi:unnamed protein product [Adineta steineri]|uniref:Palmitoyltransferase n=1 Tax=Adineta steineri TaxID=433720 RepID=A0A818GK11_9BILA|nr:unnamed protein product [Adineta steineri]
MKSIEPNVLNGGTNKPPPYPVEPPTIISSAPVPESHTADLVSAVQFGYYDRVVELIEPAPYLASTPVAGNITLLHWAALNNRVEIARYLINKRAQVDAIGGALNSTPLHWAIRDGHTEMVIFLLSHQAQISLFDAEGFSALHLASMFGRTDIVAYLVAKGEDVDILDKCGMTPLMHAVSKIKNRDPTQLLVRLGSQINYQDPVNKCTPLHYAINASNKEAVQVLLDANARTDICNSDNETPLDVARRLSGNMSLMYLLSKNNGSNPGLPKWLQFDKSSRRLGTKLLPYILIIAVAFIIQLPISLIYRGILLVCLAGLTSGYMRIFFDNQMDRYLPIAIAQASIFWLYVCYFYYFSASVHVISIHFVCIILLTYLSWSNYYLAIKRDPGFIVGNREQLYRNIIQLVEQNLFDYETFCTSCLIKRPIRSKHCKDCHRCIAKFDHHCPWIDNCVGEKNLRYFVGFLFFTPICLGLFLHASFLRNIPYIMSYFKIIYILLISDYHRNCHLFSSETIPQALTIIINCSPVILWFTFIACVHILWISGLCVTILAQIASGYTTNEKFNFWRYKYLRNKSSSPFSLGYIQNLVDLINRPICCYTPVNIDWARIYSVEDFYQAIPLRIRQKLNLSSMELSNI